MLQQALDDAQQEVAVQMSLMYLVQHYNVVRTQVAVWRDLKNDEWGNVQADRIG